MTRLPSPTAVIGGGRMGRGIAQVFLAAGASVTLVETDPDAARAVRASLVDGPAAPAVEDIDEAMRLGYRHPMGPLRLTDLVGLDVRLAIADHLHARLGPRFEPPELLRRKVRMGELGRKTGRGFYDWGDE
jgi:3-hydroxyacyl-CoA dehydrogenase